VAEAQSSFPSARIDDCQRGVWADLTAPSPALNDATAFAVNGHKTQAGAIINSAGSTNTPGVAGTKPLPAQLESALTVVGMHNATAAIANDDGDIASAEG